MAASTVDYSTTVSEEFQSYEKQDVKFKEVPVDKVREYWNRRPCNLKHSKQEIGTKQYFDDVEARKYKVEPHIPAFAEFAKWKGKRVLEIGCGLGTESVNFARAGAIVTSVDLSDKSLELCKKRFEVFGLKGRFFQANAEELEKVIPEGEQFDLIWSFGVIHHTPNPSKVVEAIHKLCAPDGEVRLMVYSRVSYKLFFLMRETGCWDFSKLDSIISNYSEAQTGCPVTYSYTFDEVRQLMKGFEVYNIFKDHIFCWDIEKYRKYEYVKEECWRNVKDDDFRELEKELGWHTCFAAKKIAN